ncbi:MAG TPA: hypothetical protein VFB38_15990 [Chthonomonadaceae bacterium]|nr:hypothetical protein [Chthonomonadaceae bacterium]
MTLIIELTPEEETRLQEAARQHGLEIQEYARQRLGLVEPRLTAPDAENQALIDLMRQWMAEDATDDLEELERRDAELAELKANLNANRAAVGAEPIFP